MKETKCNNTIQPETASEKPVRPETASRNTIQPEAASEKTVQPEKEHYKFFQNSECEYFPCHAKAEEASFNCLFCYCPLYLLGKRCGGNFKITEKGIKDCTDCVIPHSPGGYEHIREKLREYFRGDL